MHQVWYWNIVNSMRTLLGKAHHSSLSNQESVWSASNLVTGCSCRKNHQQFQAMISLAWNTLRLVFWSMQNRWFRSMICSSIIFAAAARLLSHHRISSALTWRQTHFVTSLCRMAAISRDSRPGIFKGVPTVKYEHSLSKIAICCPWAWPLSKHLLWSG